MGEQQKVALGSEEAEIAQEEKKHWTIRELITEMGHVLDNPMLAAIVEAASTPTAADRYIKRLGWPSTLAKKVRHAVRLYQFYKGLPLEWAKIKTSAIRPVDSLFRFSDEESLFSDDGVFPNVSFKFEDYEVNRSNWPLFLREFQWRESYNHVSTFDDTGKNFRFNRIRDWQDRNLFDFLHLGERSELSLKSGQGEIVFCGGGFFQKGNYPQLRIQSKSILMESLGKFPSFYKVVCIGTGWGKEEEIRIVVNQEIGPDWDDRDIGWAIFEKNIEIARDRSVARLSMKYRINSDFSCRLENPRHDQSPLGVYFINEHTDSWQKWPDIIPRTDLNPTKIAEAQGELAKLAVEIYTKGKVIPLERIAGENLFLNPPKYLFDLFTAESEEQK